MCAFAKVDALLFWKKYRPRAPVMDKISATTLLEGFRVLVGQSPPPIRLQTDHLAQATEPPPSHTLNTNITLVELLQALKKLHRNKAAGLDGMKTEFILDAGELLHMPLLTSFNCFLAKGFLEALSTRVVHAFFKGGDASKFDNYMGIMVGPILAKLFAMILDVATLLWPSVGVKPNTWKSWRFGVLWDSRMFRAQQQSSKHLSLKCSWCHWKGLET